MRTAYCLLLLAAAVPAVGQTFPFVEDFDADAANWRQNASANVLGHVAGGGPAGAGDAYASYDFDLATFTSPFGGPIVFRGQAGLGSSGGAFAGDWIAAGVNQVTAMVRHNASVALPFSGRFAAPANSPGASTEELLVPPGVWTQIAFDISPSTPYVGSGDYSTFSDIGNIQFGVSIPAGTTAAALGVVTFDLDRVSITAVPEPASAALLALAGCCGCWLTRRRRVG
ncbi:hypothetical protein Pla175_03270 [Pirellulimonas nuda]|uniref:PEP-CTERM protein-sorting domain-containing protein n=1 Tax=Pirellulimonas nuda TaxID=2528009 RepID=A0A518D672_9BACT|nr:PEP-CTERM sorting domain-containing protein [Pirellulimonas nuda]QDU86973.1 hypothetical protein Pla175_03270 [Pirellulimonas nuda]